MMRKGGMFIRGLHLGKHGLRKHLTRLQWDLVGYQWISPTTHKYLGFFQYSIKVGRSILGSTNMSKPTTFVHCHEQGLSLDFLSRFWEILWKRKQDAKSIVFQ